MTFREYFDLNNGLIHLNNAGVSPMLKAASERLEQTLREARQNAAHMDSTWLNSFLQTKQTMGDFLNADPSSIAYFMSCSAALSQVALGLDYEKGDEIVSIDQDYPSSLYPWLEASRRFGPSLKRLPVDQNFHVNLDQLLSAITQKTKIVALSWVSFQNGMILPLKQIAQRCREVNALFCVDIIQGVGSIPFDFKASGADFVAFGAHKWLAAGMGLGVFVYRPELIDQLRPLSVGAFSFGDYTTPFNPTGKFHHHSARFEPGTPPIGPALALEASLKVIQQYGVERIQKEAEQLATLLRKSFPCIDHNPFDCDFSSPITVIRPRHLETAILKLKQNKISFGLRGGGIRLSPHAFNTPAEIEKVKEVLCPL